MDRAAPCASRQLAHAGMPGERTGRRRRWRAGLGGVVYRSRWRAVIALGALGQRRRCVRRAVANGRCRNLGPRSEEHTSELQSLMRISYAGFCLKKTKEKRMLY